MGFVRFVAIHILNRSTLLTDHAFYFIFHLCSVKRKKNTSNGFCKLIFNNLPKDFIFNHSDGVRCTPKCKCAFTFIHSAVATTNIFQWKGATENEEKNRKKGQLSCEKTFNPGLFLYVQTICFVRTHKKSAFSLSQFSSFLYGYLKTSHFAFFLQTHKFGNYEAQEESKCHTNVMKMKSGNINKNWTQRERAKKS